MSLRLLLFGTYGDSVDTEPPAAPTGVNASDVGSTGFTVNWTANQEPDLKDYRVYRSTTSSGAGFSVAATVGPGGTSFPFTGLSAGQTSWIYVTARDLLDNESAPSDVIEVKTVATYYVSNTGDDANAGTSEAAPLQTITAVNALNLSPTDQILFNRGDSFTGHLQVSQTDITVGAYGAGANPVVSRITMSGDRYALENLDVDQAGGASNPITIESADDGTITSCDIHDSTNNGIDIRNSTGTTIQACEIYNCLKGNWNSDPIQDAHGVVLTADQMTASFTLLDTEIHHVSGDSFQVNPNRTESNFDITVYIEGCTFWTGPLASDFNAGWVTGNSPGENAVDTKADSTDSGSLTIEMINCECYGFSQDASTPPAMTNRAALNLKENILATVDRITIRDSEIAFRVRGDEGRGAARVTIKNAVAYDCDKSIRAESSIPDFKVYNSTFGSGITTFLEEAAGGIGMNSDLRNNAFLGTKPAAFSDATNINATSDDFSDSASDDYRLLEGSDLIDAGDSIAAVTVDRNGTARTQTVGTFEVGAYTGFVSAPGEYAYFNLLAAHPNIALQKAFRTQQEIDDTYLVPTSGAYDEGRWVYDAAQDAVRVYFDALDGSLSTGEQLRWGDTGGYNEVVPTSFGTLGTGTFLFVWDWRFDANWAISARDDTVENFTLVHKAFQIARSTEITIEPRFRFSGGSAQFAAPTGNQVCHLDIRSYEGSSGAPGDGVPQDATIFPVIDEWFRMFVFVDGGNLELSFWACRDGDAPAQLINRQGGFTTDIRDIKGFWYELNSSQNKSGIPVESHMWGRNWSCVSGLTYAQAAALVAQSSW